MDRITGMHLRCPHCQNPIELADLPSGGEVTCAGCGSSFQLASMSTATWQKPENKRIGKFEILDTVGQGAFGIVLKARDAELDRIVAIKVPRAGNIGAGSDDVDRFLREARAVAQLRFPSIITVLEVGTDNGTPYLVSDFVEGITLADHLTGRGFTFTESAKLLAEVADALQYAHSLGVVHRDVKPSNIMIRPDGSPCVMDFGLAKRDAGEITMTIDGQILGTPAYMSPEQARGEGHQVDGKSDVYSLGVILYQMLTGELPFRGNKAMLLHQVLHEEPKSPRSLNDKIPRDLETIALKAMAKEPGRRYASAREMAEDLRRWLASEPILARPVGTVESLWRWCKRKPALAIASGEAIFGLLLALAIFATAYFMVIGALENEKTERGKAESLAIEMQRLADEADKRRDEAETLALKIGFNSLHAKSSDNSALALVGMAQIAARAFNLRNKTLFESVQLHAGGWVSHATTNQLRRMRAHASSVNQISISADGKFALVGTSADARLWDTQSGDLIGKSMQHDGQPVLCVALSGDGTIALTGGEDKVARLWTMSTGKPIGAPLRHQDRVNAVALSADGKIALTGCEDKTATAWDTSTGKPIGMPRQHENAVHAVGLSADGKIALTASLRTARLWTVATGEPIGITIHPDSAQGEAIGVPQVAQPIAIALSADGKYALLGSQNKTARLWDVASGKVVFAAPLQHQDRVSAVALSADGKFALTGCGLMMQLWNALTGEVIGPALYQQDRVTTVALSADGKFLASGSGMTTRLFKRSNDPPVLRHRAGFQVVALSADAKLAVTGSYDTIARVWDITTRKELGPTQRHPGEVKAVALTTDGKTALSASSDHMARLWETANGNSAGPLLAHPCPVKRVALSGDGKTALTLGSDGKARRWITSNGAMVGMPLEQTDIEAIAMDGDGRLALTGNSNGTAQVWESATGKPTGISFQHRGPIRAVALSLDGKIAITGADDGTAQVWETATGKLIGPILQSQYRVRAVALSADGKIALTTSWNVARFWEITSGKSIGAPLLHRDEIWAIGLSADGRTALTGSAEVIARLWTLPRLAGNHERIVHWAQVVTGIEADEDGNAHVLDEKTWQQRRQRLQDLGGPPND